MSEILSLQVRFFINSKMNQQHRSKPKENGENEGSNRKRNRPEPLRNLNDNANDEYKPVDIFITNILVS